MQKQIKPIDSDEPSGFSWVRDPEFTPPGEDGGLDACVTHEFAAPRTGELKTLLEAFLENIISVVGATAGIVRLLPPDGRTLKILSSTGRSAELQAEAERCIELDCGLRHPQQKHIPITVLETSQFQVRDAIDCKSCHFKSTLNTPLEASNASLMPLGILTLFFDQPNKLSAHNIQTISAFAKTMSAAIEHTHISREAKRIELLNERQVLANDVHDSIAQTLTYARMRISLLHEAIRSGNSEMAEVYANDVDEALQIGQKSTRELIADHRCDLNHSGLSAALYDISSEFQKRYNINIEYHNRLVDLELPLEHEIQVYYIVHEALNNIARHSGATHARIFVDSRFGFYVFTVEDNGRGSTTFSPVEGHYGMMIMRERAHRIGGTIKMGSASGLGTQIQLFFPEPSLGTGE